jgi:hypothetical protein
MKQQFNRRLTSGARLGGSRRCPVRFWSESQGEPVKTAKRHLANLLALAAPAMLGVAAAMEAYIVLYPGVTAPYGIGAGSSLLALPAG